MRGTAQRMWTLQEYDAALNRVEAELATARKQLLEYEQTEAAVLPENVGIKEYVGSLKSQLATAQEEIETYKDALATKFNAELCEALKPLRLKIATAQEENKRLREALELYGEHTYLCGVNKLLAGPKRGPCNCGLEKALKE